MYMCIENPLSPSIMTLWLVVFNTLFFFLILLSNCLLYTASYTTKKRLEGDFLLKRRDLPTAFSHDNMEKRLWWSQLLSSKEAATCLFNLNELEPCLFPLPLNTKGISYLNGENGEKQKNAPPRGGTILY